MSTPIGRPASANDINTGHFEERLYQAKKAPDLKYSLFHGRTARELREPISVSTFRIEDDTVAPYQMMADRACTSTGSASSLSSLTSTQTGMTACNSGVHQTPQTAPGRSFSFPQDNRDAYIINMHTFRPENHPLRRDAADSACLQLNWWERNKKWNSTFIISTLATATTVVASLLSDMIRDGDQALFQRSGSVIVCWALLVTFITLRKRSEKMPSHELMIEATNPGFSREGEMRLRDLSEQIGDARVTARKVKKTASECDWVILLASIIGTLIWGYGDLVTR